MLPQHKLNQKMSAPKDTFSPTAKAEAEFKRTKMKEGSGNGSKKGRKKRPMPPRVTSVCRAF